MKIRWLNLDDALGQQPSLAEHYSGQRHDLRDWGPCIRLACSFSRFRRFERSLAGSLGPEDKGPYCTFYGSGDFHHVSLALVRRVRQPFNLLVIDNHPDWMRGVPLLHCGTWLYHAARHANVRRVFHVGGDVDFDNGYRFLAPRDLLRSGKIVVFPARRLYQGGMWKKVPHQPLRADAETALTAARLHSLLEPLASVLREFPLYISIDKDVMRAADSVVNWDSGHLTLAEVLVLLRGFREATELIGMDIVGDWSPVKTRGMLRRFLHWTEHQALDVDAPTAAQRNEATNRALLAAIQG